MDTSLERRRRENAQAVNSNPAKSMSMVEAAKAGDIDMRHQCIALAKKNGVSNPLFLKWIEAALQKDADNNSIINAIIRGEKELVRRIVYEKAALIGNVTRFFQPADTQIKGYKTTEVAGFKPNSLLVAIGAFETVVKDSNGAALTHANQTPETLRERAKKTEYVVATYGVVDSFPVRGGFLNFTAGGKTVLRDEPMYLYDNRNRTDERIAYRNLDNPRMFLKDESLVLTHETPQNVNHDGKTFLELHYVVIEPAV